jgi:DNA-binding NarL/FixJ family response regulator
MPVSPVACSLVDSADRSQMIRVGIAHAQPLVRAGLRAVLERESGITVVDEAADGDDAVAIARRLRPDVVLLDVRLPGLDCVEATRRILAESSAAVIVVTTTEADPRVFSALKAGAAGVLLEDREPGVLVRALRLFARVDGRRTQRSRRSQSAREVPMLMPKVIEITRGCAHAEKAAQVTSGAQRLR